MYSIIKLFKGKFKNQKVLARTVYLADSVSDVANLPTSSSKGAQDGSDSVTVFECSVGSVCRVAEDSSEWVLNNQDEWVKVTNSSSSSGSSSESSSSSLDMATDEEVEEALDDTFG